MRYDRFATAAAAVFLVLVAMAAANRAACDDTSSHWPQFHGPNRDNMSTETDLLKRWPISGPKLLWTARGIGSGYSSVSLAHGLIYTTGNIGDHTVITALDLDGEIQWQYQNGRAWKDPKPGSRATPTIDGDRLYHKNPHGDLVCLGAVTGARNWGFNILKTFGAENIRWAVSESLLVDGQRLICCPGGPQTAVVALDKSNSGTVWKSPSTRELAGYASPSVGVVGELRIIATMTAKACIGVNAETGELLWHERHITPWDENICMPILQDGCVFYSTGHRVGSVKLKVNINGDKVTTEVLWRSRELDNHHGGVILFDEFLYGSGHRGGWICVDWETGETKYNEPGVGKGSLTYADGMLYTLSERSRMGLVRATPERHELVSEFRLPAGGEGPSWAHPVVCGGRLYIRHDDYLFAYDIYDESRSNTR
jgi:outer membrane protein assembly factor BamB